MKQFFRNWLRGLAGIAAAFVLLLPASLLLELLGAMQRWPWLHEPWRTVLFCVVLALLLFGYPFYVVGVWRAWFNGRELHPSIAFILSRHLQGKTPAHQQHDHCA